ncbi:hypothetical protein PBT90_12610 [Algoriphagus halophytocola]|uniref:DUF2147 domain-containing protein n=1 Tax=Algoriphagus halophytocola TaxID=2991499 RepID=A0ABY6MKC1_9BACT|nr:MULTISPECIES: hypothetical protein [unclassified Algoriphagus]UZD24227.1 hypothetical protein OM944_06935 [Algoriphagus sp. TR-M5]WBL41596.1 hypothetical protein PBT90_12610 [Algoriphagus sp. TR-M9]
MRTIRVFILLVTVFTFLSISYAEAQRVSTPRAGRVGSWKVLGTVTASHSADHDVIVVKGPYDFFRRLKFKVTDSPLNMRKIIVRYDDGGRPEELNTRFEIPKGGESRIIDLKGGRRKLKSVEFWYDTKGILNGKAHVTLFGIK